MIDDIQKMALAISFAYMSGDMDINIIRMPKARNKFLMTINAKDGSFENVLPTSDGEKANKLLKDVVLYLMKNLYSNEVFVQRFKDFLEKHDGVVDIDELSQLEISEDEIYMCADKIYHDCFLLEGETKVDENDLLQNISCAVEFLEDCMKYVNKGSVEHQVLHTANSLLTGIFYFIGLPETREGRETLNLEECIDECADFAIMETMDKRCKWREKEETQIDEALDKEIARLLTYGLLAKNVDLCFGNDLKADNTLCVEYNSGGNNQRYTSYIHNKDTKYEMLDILRDTIYNSILGNNFRSAWKNAPDFMKEIQAIRILKEYGFCRLGLERFLQYYLRNGFNEVNYGRDSHMLNAIMLNISSLMKVGKGTHLDIDDKMLTLGHINTAFDINYDVGQIFPQFAYESAFQIDKLISDFYK